MKSGWEGLGHGVGAGHSSQLLPALLLLEVAMGTITSVVSGKPSWSLSALQCLLSLQPAARLTSQERQQIRSVKLRRVQERSLGGMNVDLTEF